VTLATDRAASSRTSQQSPVAIICGGGSLPFAVADAAITRGRAVHLFGIANWADARSMARYPHTWINLGQFGRLRRMLAQQGCREVVWIGSLLRPALRSIRFDIGTLRILPQLYRAFRGGDDHLLSGIGRIFEAHGFHMIGAHEIAPEILAGAGSLAARSASDKELADIALGFTVIDAMAPYDIGQAVVVVDNRVVAVEAAEGTDAMLARIAALRDNGRLPIPVRTGVLVKAAKRMQDRRFDLPSVGPATVELVKGAGLAGMALRAGEVIIAEPEAVVAAADRAGLFVQGVEP
jgi:DUF1009 family protein